MGYFLPFSLRGSPRCRDLPQKVPALPLLSKTPHWGVFDGQPVRPPGTGPSGFSAPNGCRRLSPKDPPPLVQGAALGMGRKASFFLFVSQKERSKEKAPFGKAFRSLRGATKGAAFGNCKPLKRLDRNFAGLRPLCKKRAFPSKPPPEGRGVHGGTGPPVRRSGARWDALADR